MNHQMPQQQEPWPHDATVKLVWDSYGPYERVIGWAKRDTEGNLVSAYSLTPLDPDKWAVVEERTQIKQH